MSKYCPECGVQMPDAAKFCPKCGSAVGQVTRQATDAVRRPQNDLPQPDLRMVTPHIGLGPDGKYRWIYEMSLFRNPTIFMMVWKILFFICIGIFVMMTIVQAADGGLDGKAILDMLGIFGIILGVMTALVVISFLIYAAIMGGKYIAMFEMDENGIYHRQLPKQARKAMGIAAASILIGMMSNSNSAVIGGIAAVNTEMYTSFGKTKKVRFYPKRDLIKIRHTLYRNQIYAKPEDFDFVRNYVLQRVPDDAKPKY